MKNLTRALTIVMVLLFLSAVASGKCVEAHIIVKRYWQPDLVMPMLILLNGLSNARIVCELAFGLV